MFELYNVPNIPKKGSGGCQKVSYLEIFEVISHFRASGYKIAEVEFTDKTDLNYNNTRRKFQDLLKRRFKNIEVTIRGNRIFLIRSDNEKDT